MKPDRQSAAVSAEKKERLLTYIPGAPTINSEKEEVMVQAQHFLVLGRGFLTEEWHSRVCKI